MIFLKFKILYFIFSIPILVLFVFGGGFGDTLKLDVNLESSHIPYSIFHIPPALAHDNDVWYSTDGADWTQATAGAQWGIREGHSFVAFNGSLWVIGGFVGDFSSPANDVWYSSDGIDWTQQTAAAQWASRASHGSLTFNSRMWVIGGSSGGNDVWYSTDGTDWTQATAGAQWSGRAGFSSLVFSNSMWLIGGQSSNDVWRSTDGKDWTRLTANAQWSARRSHTSLIYNSQMWVLGGSLPSNDVWRSTDGKDWTRVTANAKWGAREGYTSLVFSNQMWIIGGSVASGTCILGVTVCNDVWRTPTSGIFRVNARPSIVGRDSKGGGDSLLAGVIDAPDPLDVGQVIIFTATWDDENLYWLPEAGDGISETNPAQEQSSQEDLGKNWTEVATAAQFSEREDHASLVFPAPGGATGAMWVIGGLDNNQSGGCVGVNLCNDVWYSLDGIDWTLAADPAQWSARRGLTSLTFSVSGENRMWVMGGDDNNITDGCVSTNLQCNDVWYSTNGTDWTQTTAGAQFSARTRHTSVVFNNQMWVIGGDTLSGAGGEINDVWRSPDGVNWTQATVNAQWSERKNHTSLVFNNRMWLIGGNDFDSGACVGNNQCNDVWYSTDGKDWTQATVVAQFSEREAHTSLVFNNRMWLIGGNDFGNNVCVGGSPCNDIWYSEDGVDWTQQIAAARFSERQNHASLVFNNRMWVIGGWDSNMAGGCVGNPQCNDVWYSDIETVSVKLHICKTNVINNPETGGACASSWSSSTNFFASNPISVDYTTIGADVGVNDYYAFVCDDQSLSNSCSTFGLGEESIIEFANAGIDWTQAAATAQFSERYRHTSLVFNNLMWVIGGHDLNQPSGCVGVTECNDVWYSDDGIDWTLAADPAQFSERYHHTSLVFNNLMWVIGGYDNDISGGCVGVTECNDVWYSDDGIDWTLAADPAQFSERFYHTSLVFNNRMWVIGGYDVDISGGCVGVTECNDVWYSDDGIDWTQATATAQWSERNRHTSLVFNNRMWVIGGTDGGIPGGCVSVISCNDVWYSTDGIDWTLATAVAQFISRYRHTSVVFNSAMWVIGGYDNDISGGCVGGFECNDVWYSTDGVDWTLVADPAQFSERYFHTSLVYNNRMWVIGGYDTDASDCVGSFQCNDVWYSVGPTKTGTFTVTALNSAPTIDSGGVSDSPDPVAVGDNITFSINWTDSDSSNVTPHICKTNAITSPETGGACASGFTWVSGTSGAADPATATYTTGLNEYSTNRYWAFVCDDSGMSTACSSAGVEGVFWVQATAGAQFPGRGDHTSLVFTPSTGSGQAMWVIGGQFNAKSECSADIFYCNDVWYSSDGTSWTQAAAGAQFPGRYGHTSLVFSAPSSAVQAMWIMGGSLNFPSECPANVQKCNDVWYSTDGIDWTQATAGAQFPVREFHTSLVFNNPSGGGQAMWVLGGRFNAAGECPSGISYCNDVWYSTDGIDWTQATAGAQFPGRGYHTSLLFNNQMWVMGGVILGSECPSSSLRCNDVWYSTDGTDWTQATAGAQFPGRLDHTSLLFNNQMWVMGGYFNVAAYCPSSSLRCNDVWYSTDGTDWTQATAGAQWPGRQRHTSLLFNNQMWVMGGVLNAAGECPRGTNYCNDVWYSPLHAATFYVQGKPRTVAIGPDGGTYHNPDSWGGRDPAAASTPPVNDTPDPLDEGATITFSANWDDSNVFFVPEVGDGISETSPAQEQSSQANLGKNWTEGATAAQWSERNIHTSLVFNNRMWVIGGWDADISGGCVGGFECNDVWYSTDGIDWTQATIAAQFSERREHTSLVFNNRMWLIGGGDTNQAGGCVGINDCNDVWYSTDGIDWTQATAAAQFSERWRHTSLVFNNRMWVMGGDDSNQGTDDCVGVSECNDVWYSTDGIDWTKATAVAQWSERYFHTSLVFNNRMWVIGGNDGNIANGCVGGNECNDVWYSTDGIDWTQATVAAQFSERQQHTSLIFNNRMWVIGGRDGDISGGCVGGTECNDVWYSTDGIDWTQVTAAAQWSERTDFTALVFNNRMWVIGGRENDAGPSCISGNYCNDVWSADIEDVLAKFHICKTNVINSPETGGSCASGWTSTSAFSGADPVSIDYITQAADVATSPNNYYAFICDNSGGANACSLFGISGDEIIAAGTGADWASATGAAQWAERERHSSLVYNNRMWVMGGEDADSGACVGVWECNDVWYSTDGIDWTQATAAAQWTDRDSFASLVYNNPSGGGQAMWIMGGTDSNSDCIGGNECNDVWYSTDGVDWTQATAAAQWSERWGLTSLVFKNRMWVIGGYDNNNSDCIGGNECNDVWYSTDGVDWTQATAAAQWPDRYRHTSLVFAVSGEDRMWVIGGYAPECVGVTECNDVWYSTDGIDWTQATAAAQWTDRRNHTSLVYNNQMWVIGGYGCGGALECNDVWYSTDGIDWTQATASAPWSERLGHTSLVFNNQMWVIGGDDGDQGPGDCVAVDECNDVWYSPTKSGTFTVNAVGGFNVSGTFYDSGHSGVPAQCDGPGGTENLSLRVNGGGLVTAECLSSDGTFTFTGVSASANDTITIYSTGAQKGNRVYVSDATADTGMDLYRDMVAVGDESDGTIIIADMFCGDGNDATCYDNDQNPDDMLFDATDASPDTLSVESGIELHIHTSDTFAPTGNVTTQGAAGDLHIDDSAIFTGVTTEDHVIAGDVLLDPSATLTAPPTEDDGTMTVGADWTADSTATFTSGTGLITFDTNTAGTITTGGTDDSHDFYDVNISKGAAVTVDMATDDIDIDGDFAITTANSTFDVTAAGCTGSVSCDMTVAGAWTSTAGGTFTERTGTVTFDHAAASSVNINSSNDDFYDVIFNDAAAGATFLLQSAMDVNNDLTITGGILDANSGGPYAITIGGNFTNNDTFTARTGTVTFDDNTQTSIINGSGTPAITFYNLTSTTASKTLNFVSDKTFKIASGGKLTITGTSGSEIVINSDGSINAGVNWTQATAGAQFPGRNYHTSLVFNNPSGGGQAMWVMGGYMLSASECPSGSNRCNDVWYSTDGVDWTQATAGAQFPGRNYPTSLVFNNQMWVMGGNFNTAGECPSGSTPCNDVWYSTDGTDWTQATAGAQFPGRNGHTSLVFNNQMWVMGGFFNIAGECPKGTNYCNDVWYSTDGIDWTQATAGAQFPGRSIHTSLVFNNQMWVMGGFFNIAGECPKGTNYCNDVWYSTDGADWTQATGGAQFPGRIHPTSLVFNNPSGGGQAMWVIGGVLDSSECPSGSSRCNDVWYSTDGADWTQATAGAQFPVRRGHTSLVFNNQMWVMGGWPRAAGECPANAWRCNDVWYSPGDQWLIDHQGTEDVQYANISNSGCALGTTNISLDGSSIDSGNNGPCWLFPAMSFLISTTSASMDLNAGNTFTDEAITNLVVTSRAENGYAIYAYETQLLTNGGETIADFVGSGSPADYEDPDDWDNTCDGGGADYCGYGYTTNDDSLPGANTDRFTNATGPLCTTAPCYAAFAPIADAPGDIIGSFGSPVDDDVTTVRYRTSVSAAQPFGTYTTTIIYILTPTF